MNEEIKIIISAQINDLKAGCKQATDAINGIDEEGAKASKNSESHFSKMGNAAKKAGAVMAKALAAGITAAATGVVALTKAAVEGYAEYEQLVGGVETLFKDSANVVQGYAENAYKTAGLSANEYMETITGFSASLLQSLGGDTAKAAEVGNQAVIDMSDNANKMGTSMESIQNAYAGFAKGNFTMLDNLKLGYGGTKEEMERLLAKAQEISGVEYDISSFADITEAIHVVQTELGITGTTAKEAASTISGSAGMMKSAWANLVTGLADDNANFEQLVSNLVESISAFLGNLLPRIQVALNGIVQLIQQLVPQLLAMLPGLVSTLLPAVIDAALQLVLAVAGVLPQLISTILEVVPQITQAILGALPTLITTLLQVVAQIITTLGEILPTIIEQIVAILPQIVASITENIPVLLQAAVDFLLAIVEAIPVVIPMLIEALPQIISSILNAVIAAIPILLQGAISLFKAIIQAIPVIITSLGTALPQIIDTIITAVVEAIPLLLDGAIELLTAIIEAIPIILPVLIETLPDIILSILDAVMNALPLLLSAAVDLFLSIVSAIPMILPDLIKALPKIIQTIINALINYAPQLLHQGISLFMGIVNSIGQVIPKIASKLGEIISTIKTKLVDAAKNAMKFDWSLPKIKLPHFSISGKFSLDPPSIPKINVDWYARGGVFDTPTLFPYGGRIGGLGEAGAEAIVPLEKNTQWLDKIAERLQGGGQPIYLQVDGKTFAEISVDSLNQLTRQRGSLPLVFA